MIVANWKNHPETMAEAIEILEFTDNYLESLTERKDFSLVFCPPFVFLEEVAKLLRMSHFEHSSFLGAQDISTDDKTAVTGEISGTMLSRLGVQYVIIGHSERRWKLGESDEVTNQKLKTALRDGLIPIVCIGERTRDNDFRSFLEDQVRATFDGLTTDELSRCIVAYEPVWAISTNPSARSDTPESALESIRIIKGILNSLFDIYDSLFLYGGSINSKNAHDFLKEPGIDGVLVGGASVNKEEFVRILGSTR